MENKDAIYYLLYIKHHVIANSPNDIALDMAIEALKPKKPKTNGDRIRQMTDEELADWLTDGHDKCDICKLCSFGACRVESECEKGVLEWLKQEVDPNMTNGDKIRAMTDEELVDVLDDIAYLRRQEQRFMDCVESGTPPAAIITM